MSSRIYLLLVAVYERYPTLIAIWVMTLSFMAAQDFYTTPRTLHFLGSES
jgi:hypothetical protein